MSILSVVTGKPGAKRAEAERTGERGRAQAKRAKGSEGASRLSGFRDAVPRTGKDEKTQERKERKDCPRTIGFSIASNFL